VLQPGSGDFDEGLRAPVHQNQEVVELLFPDQIALLLSDEDSLTDLEQLFGVG
jgi:hypothetical protein